MRLVLMRRQWLVALAALLVAMGVAAGYYQAGGGSEVVLTQQQGPTAAAGMVNDRDDGGQESFYVDCRLDRERSRGRQVEYLRAIIDDPQAAGGERSRAQNELLRITQEIEKETSIENILRARGFPEAVVLFQGRVVTVVLPHALNEDERASVVNLVARGTGAVPEEVMVIDAAQEKAGKTS